MDSHVIRSQTIHISSALRQRDERASNFTVNIPEGIIGTSDSSHILRLTLIDFSMPILWNWVNPTNNEFQVNDETDNVTHIITIPPANYTFKALASAISQQLSNVIPNASCAWSPSTNKLTLSFPTDKYWSVNFDVEKSAFEMMGFNKRTYILLGDATLTSTSSASALRLEAESTLKLAQFDRLCLTATNVTVQQQFANVENTADNTCVINKNIMSIPFTSPPFDVISYVNVNNEMQLYIKERSLTSLHLVVRDENGEELPYVSDWKASIRVDVIDVHSASQQSHYAAMLDLLSKMEEKLSLILVQRSL